MNNLNFHPVLTEPPLAHALHRWDETTRKLTYEYNGEDIISMIIPECDEVGFRHGSDGTMQSIQYIQQIYVMLNEPLWVDVEFMLSGDTIVMKPHRSDGTQAILSQTGSRLLNGVNGLYDVTQDLLIDFNGVEWRWKDERIRKENGKSFATAQMLLNEKPLFINLRMQYYRKHLGYEYHKPWTFKPKQKAVAGWCSWEAYRRDVSLDKIETISAFMKDKFEHYGLEYIQVDDGYQKMPLPANPKGTMAEGWMTCVEEKFPGGHDTIVSTIKKHGFKPGIWTNSNITNPEFPKFNEDSLIFHEGKPLKGEWIDFLYNCSPETLEKHVKPIFKGYNDHGYDYIKIDAIRHLLYDGLHEAVRLGIMTNDDAQDRFRRYMEATKEGLERDDIYYLASWGEMQEVIGLVDACRISMDANPTWAGIRMQLFEMARWQHSQRILFLNDPDHVCVRTKPEWAKTVLSLISLGGGLLMLSDTEDAYTDEKVDIIRKTLPPLASRTAETGPLNMEYPAYTWTKLHGFAVQSNEQPVQPEDVELKDAIDMAGNYPSMNEDHPFSTLWAHHLDEYNHVWSVIGRYATVPLKASSLALAELALDDVAYHVFDFWNESYLGIHQGHLDVPALDLGHSQILAFRKVEARPQFVASTRHVSMDAISITNIDYTDMSQTLSLNTVPNTHDDYYFVLPEDYALDSVQLDGTSIDFSNEAGLVKVPCDFKSTGHQLVLNYHRVVS